MARISARCNCVTMPLESWPHAARHVDVGLAQEALGGAAIEARMHAGDEIQRLAHLQPARQHRHVGDEAHIAHQLVTLRARIEPHDAQIALKEVSPRMALRAVVLPAPFGPMRPTMRPGWTVKLTPSSARCAPNALRQAPRFNYCCHLLHPVLRGPGGTLPPAAAAPSRSRSLAESPSLLDAGEHLRPLVLEEALPLVLQQRLARPDVHEHARGRGAFPPAAHPRAAGSP